MGQEKTGDGTKEEEDFENSITLDEDIYRHAFIFQGSLESGAPSIRP